MRLIDTDKLLEKTECLFKDLNSTEDYMGIGYNHGVGDSIAIIKNAPTIEAEPVKHGRWIPVSERLPEEDGYYLTYGDWPDGYLILAFKHIRNWKKGHFFIAPFWNSPSEIVDRAVIAWMPLPEPYKREDNDEEGEA